MKYSLFHLECRFFSLKSQSMILFSRSGSVEKRPMKLGLEIEIEFRDNILSTQARDDSSVVS